MIIIASSININTENEIKKAANVKNFITIPKPIDIKLKPHTLNFWSIDKPLVEVTSFFQGLKKVDIIILTEKESNTIWMKDFKYFNNKIKPLEYHQINKSVIMYICLYFFYFDIVYHNIYAVNIFNSIFNLLLLFQ